MKIALVSPKGPLYRHRGGIFKKSLRYAPLTLTTLAALVPPELDANVRIYDEGVQELPDSLDAELVGMTVITGTAPRSYELARRFRAEGKKVVLGGPHVTLAPDDAAQHADVIVTGYAEDTWPQLLRDHAYGNLQTRYAQAADFNLDKPVFAKRELLPASHYLTRNVFEATRSCLHACDFCVAPAAWGRRHYQKPVEHVVEDIKRQRARKLIFIDLNLVADVRYARRLFEALIPLNVRWFGLATTLIGLNPELMDLMARSGCSGLLLGFESINTRNLSGSKKGFNAPDRYARLVADLHARGISVMGCFVFGMDDDTSEVFAETARFVIDAAIDLPRFALLTPFPGTPLYNRLEREGRILTRNWELYDGQHVVFRPKRLSVEELVTGHQAAWKKVYSMPSIARRLLKSRTQLPLSVVSNLGYRFYANHLHDFYNCDWIIGQRETEKEQQQCA